MGESKGRVCEKHNEYAADGQCRWCEPRPEIGGPMTAAEIRERNPTLLEVAKAAEPFNPYLKDAPYVPFPLAGAPTPAPADEPPRYAASRYLGLPVKVDPEQDPIETRYALRRLSPQLVKCRCGEITFDERRYVNCALYEESGGRSHSPPECRDLPRNPLEAMVAKVAEILFKRLNVLEQVDMDKVVKSFELEARPPSFMPCRCGEVMFNPAMYGPNTEMKHHTTYAVHTPTRCEDMRLRYLSGRK